jgi:60S ribosome subunit biogenesis protein NIP7
MRPLTEDETRMVFEKLHKFIGKNIKALVERTDDPHCLRLQKNKVFYVREDLMRRATNIARDKLIALGTCIGKFTHSGKFRLTIGSLDVLSQYSKYKVGPGIILRTNVFFLIDVQRFISAVDMVSSMM